MPYDPFTDPEIAAAAEAIKADYPDQATFEQEHDRVRGRILTVEKIKTRFGPTIKYMLMTDNGQPIAFLTGPSGSKNLFAQWMAAGPQVGDTVDVELIELRSTAQGVAKLFDVKVERGNAATLAPTPPASAPAADPFKQADADGGEDLFDR